MTDMATVSYSGAARHTVPSGSMASGSQGNNNKHISKIVVIDKKVYANIV